MAFTTPDLVQAVLGKDYGPLPDGTLPDLQQYIDRADVTVLRAQQMALKKNMPLTSQELEIFERWLAAYYYTQMDPIYQSRSNAGASASFVSAGQGADPNRYRQAAIEADYSGSVNALLKRQSAGGFWNGSDPRRQRPPGEC